MSAGHPPSVTDEPVVAESIDLLDSGEAGGQAIRGGVLRTLGYGVSLAMSLVSVPLMIRHLGVVDYGYYVTVASIVFIIGGITEAGLTNLGTRQYAVLDDHEREPFLQNLTGLRFALTLTGVLAATLLTWATGARTIVVQGTLLTGVALLLTLSQQTYAIPLMAKLKLGWVTGLDLLKQGLLTGLIVACVIAGAGLLPFFAASIGSGLGVLAATVILVRGEGSLRPRFDRAAWLLILREVLPYAAAAAVGLVYFRLAVILMSYVASAHETGIYSAAFRLVEVAAVIPWLVVSSSFPILARAADRDADRLRYALQRLFEVSTIVGVLAALGIVLGAEFAIGVVAGLPRYDESVPVLRLLGLAMLTSFLVATWSFALLSLKEYTALLRANALAAVVACAGVVALEPVWGARGAAVATVAAEAVLALAYLWSLRRVRPDLTPRVRFILKVLTAAAAGGLAALLPVPSLVAALVGGAVYVAVLFALRAVPPEILAALLRR
jgi:O-antigen/teichoic acid export membrane protein